MQAEGLPLGGEGDGMGGEHGSKIGINSEFPKRENVNLTQSLSYEKRYKGFPFFVGGGGLLWFWAAGWRVCVSGEWGAGQGGV